MIGISATLPPIGIIGCGNLGLQFSKHFSSTGQIGRENLMLSHANSEKTRDKIRVAGLKDCIQDNQYICNNAEIILIGLRPQDVSILEKYQFRAGTLLISLMAAITTNTLKELTKLENVARVMTSSPEFNEIGKGIGVVFGSYSSWIEQNILDFCMQTHQATREDEIDLFTAGVNIPVIKKIYKRYDSFGLIDKCFKESLKADTLAIDGLINWSKAICEFENEWLLDSIVSKATKNGILECMLSCAQNNMEMVDILQSGINCVRRLSKSCQIQDVKTN